MKIDARDILYFVVLITAALLCGYAINQNTVAINQAHRALCNEKSQYALNIKATRAYLREHPDGAPALHITARQLQNNITNNEKYLTALRDIKCSR